MHAKYEYEPDQKEYWKNQSSWACEQCNFITCYTITSQDAERKQRENRFFFLQMSKQQNKTSDGDIRSV